LSRNEVEVFFYGNASREFIIKQDLKAVGCLDSLLEELNEIIEVIGFKEIFAGKDLAWTAGAIGTDGWRFQAYGLHYLACLVCFI
jgi:hypothetical protein